MLISLGTLLLDKPATLQVCHTTEQNPNVKIVCDFRAAGSFFLRLGGFA